MDTRALLAVPQGADRRRRCSRQGAGRRPGCGGLSAVAGRGAAGLHPCVGGTPALRLRDFWAVARGG